MHIDSLQSKEDVKKSESWVVDVSITMESNEKEHSFTNILPIEDDEEPWTTEDPVSHHQVVDRV